MSWHDTRVTLLPRLVSTSQRHPKPSQSPTNKAPLSPLPTTLFCKQVPFLFLDSIVIVHLPTPLLTSSFTARPSQAAQVEKAKQR